MSLQHLHQTTHCGLGKCIDLNLIKSHLIVLLGYKLSKPMLLRSNKRDTKAFQFIASCSSHGSKTQILNSEKDVSYPCVYLFQSVEVIKIRDHITNPIYTNLLHYQSNEIPAGVLIRASRLCKGTN